MGLKDLSVKDTAAASSRTAARNKLAKEIKKRKKKYVELLAYVEPLRHYSEVKAFAGGKDEE